MSSVNSLRPLILSRRVPDSKHVHPECTSLSHFRREAQATPSYITQLVGDVYPDSGLRVGLGGSVQVEGRELRTSSPDFNCCHHGLT